MGGTKKNIAIVSESVEGEPVSGRKKRELTDELGIFVWTIVNYISSVLFYESCKSHFSSTKMHHCFRNERSQHKPFFAQIRTGGR